MTDLATALAGGRAQLTPFDGKDVLRTTIAITNAGDGLSEAMKVDPQEFHHGEKVYVVLECDVAKVRFDPIKDTDALSRVHILRAGDATIVDGDLVEKQIAEQRERILAAKEEAAGITRIPFGDDAEPDEEDELDVLRRQHAVGAHDEGDPREGCPDCKTEVGDDEPTPIS